MSDYSLLLPPDPVKFLLFLLVLGLIEKGNYSTLSLALAVLFFELLTVADGPNVSLSGFLLKAEGPRNPPLSDDPL